MSSVASPWRVLVVEDEPLIAMHVCSLLEDLGFEGIQCAHDLAAARALLAREAPSLAILDVNLGGELVFPLAEELRRRGAAIVFSSAYGKDGLPREWLACPLALKPLTLAGLAAALDALGVEARKPAADQAD